MSGDAPIRRGRLLALVQFHCTDFFEAFRIHMRTDTLALDSIARNDPGQVAEKIQLAKDLTATLRRNVVQAKRVETPSGEAAWRGYRVKRLFSQSVDALRRIADHRRY